MYKRAYFLCCATYHLTVALYYAMQVEWGNTERILVWQNNTNAVVDKELLEKYFDKVIYVRGRDLVYYPFLEQQVYKIVNAGWLFRFSKIGELLHEKPEGNIVFLFNDTTRLTDKTVYEFGKRGNKIVLIEEGTGTYSHSNSLHNLKTRIGNVMCGQKVEPYIGANPHISTVIARHIDDLPKYQTNGRIVVEQNHIFFDDSWIKKILDIFRPVIMKYLYPRSAKMALWIGEPLSPSLKSEEDEQDVLDSIFTVINREYNIIVKMHPREDKNKYNGLIAKHGIRIIEDQCLSWFPVEMIANVLEPDVVLTPFSSAPIGIKSCIKAIYCYKLFDVTTSNQIIARLEKKRKNTYNVATMNDLILALAQKPCVGDEFIKNHNKDISYIQEEISE